MDIDLIKLDKFNAELGEFSQQNLYAVKSPYPNMYKIYDEEGHELFSVPDNTPPLACSSAWRCIVAQSNHAYNRGRESAFKQLRDLIGAQGVDNDRY